MTIHNFSSREFTRDVSAAKRAAMEGPVFITDRGRPAFALERRTPPQGGALRAWLNGVRLAFVDRILPFTGNTALEHRFTLVTSNVSDFAGTGVALVNP